MHACGGKITIPLFLNFHSSSQNFQTQTKKLIKMANFPHKIDDCGREKDGFASFVIVIVAV